MSSSERAHRAGRPDERTPGSERAPGAGRMEGTGEFPFLIGTAAAEITPPVGVTLAGYKPRVSNGVAHPLRAEALYCAATGSSGRAGAWLLVACDLIGFPLSYTNELRAEISARTGLKPGAVLLCGTHTHSGPGVILVSEDEQTDADTVYLSELKRGLTALAERAAASAAPGRFETAETQAPGLSANRRVTLEDGTWGNEWEDPDGRHTGYNDPAVLLGVVARPDGTREALLVNFGCHPVTLGPSSLEISPDYPGYLKDTLERGGAAKTAIFLLAGAGNINPRVCIRTGDAYPRLMGEALAASIFPALGRLLPAGGGTVGTASIPWRIVRTRDAFKFRGQPAPNAGDTLETELVALSAGDVGFIGIPGELFSEYNRPIREESPFRHTFIVTLANDYAGYFPTDRAQEEGAYETKMAPASGLEKTLLAEVRRALEAARKTGGEP
jgi:neutral ceramidase